jgi:hypothetical protein
METSIPNASPDDNAAQQTQMTVANLHTLVMSDTVRNVSMLTLPEIEQAVQEIGELAPAGNIPAVILNGLARLPGRKPPPDMLKRDMNLLFKGIDQVLDRAIYGAFFATPARVIWAYQNILRLAGKDLDESFPEGTWQFYVDYALREDTARHANETHGFDTMLSQHHIELTDIDRMTAWAMTAIYTLHQYNLLLENEWRERVYIDRLRQLVNSDGQRSQFAALQREWAQQRPYRRASKAASETYPSYRRKLFDQYIDTAMQPLSEGLRRQWSQHIHEAETNDLPAYQRQMSILAYLEPGDYGETRVPLPVEAACVGLIYDGRYYLIPICQPGTTQPAAVATVRAQIQAIVEHPSSADKIHLTELAGIRRAALADLRKRLSKGIVGALDSLKQAPILLNFDQRARNLTLSDLRQTERGIGSHAFTIFDAKSSFVFDMSHIFFDGGWGATLAEIMTNEALSWAVYLNVQPPDQTKAARPSPLNFKMEPTDFNLVRQAPRVATEVGVESVAVRLNTMLRLRNLFKRRSDTLHLTVNDLLLLYRAIHAVLYQPSNALLADLQQLASVDNSRQAAQAALDALKADHAAPPAILVPIDGSQHSPRDRVFPMTFEVPLHDLDLIRLHSRCLDALFAYQNAAGNRRQRNAAYAEFDQLQREYLAALAGFGIVLRRAKEIALSGESTSVGAIKMLAELPRSLQHFLDQVPNRFDILNDIIKGREVFSNLGVVAKGSSLCRFHSARDDNEKKTLVWGIITDMHNVMHVSLRDFRPHVRLLSARGHRDMAIRIAQEYLDEYVNGLNQYIQELQQVTWASRETRSDELETIHHAPDDAD